MTLRRTQPPVPRSPIPRDRCGTQSHPEVRALVRAVDRLGDQLDGLLSDTHRERVLTAQLLERSAALRAFVATLLSSKRRLGVQVNEILPPASRDPEVHALTVEALQDVLMVLGGRATAQQIASGLSARGVRVTGHRVRWMAARGGVGFIESPDGVQWYLARSSAAGLQPVRRPEGAELAYGA